MASIALLEMRISAVQPTVGREESKHGTFRLGKRAAGPFM